MKSSRNLFVAFGLGAIAAFVLFGYLIWSDHEQALRSAETRTRDYAAILETRLDATLRRADATLLTLVRDVPIAALSKQAVPTHAGALDARLDVHITKFPELAGLRIFDDAGDQLYSSNRASTPRGNVVDRDYFRRLRDDPQAGLVFSAVNISRTTGRPTLVVGRALRDGRGVFRGIVIASVELEYLQKLFKSLTVGAHGIVSVHRSDNFTLVVRQPQGDSKFNATLPSDNPARMALVSGSKQATAEFSSSTDGIVRIYSFHVLDPYPFFVSVGMAREEALAAWHVRALAVGLSAALLLGLLSTLLLRLLRAEVRRAESMAALAQSEGRFRALFDRASDGITVLSLSGQLLAANEAFALMHGYRPEEIRMLNLNDLNTPETCRLAPERMQRILADGLASFQVEHYHKDGHAFALDVSSSLISSVGEPLIQSFYRDITKRKQLEDEIRQLAFHDPLTKLPNRRLLLDRLSQALADSKRSGRYGALMFLDLDNFKALNDTAGHAVGDLLLMQAAKRMKSCVREVDTVARFGGDEFVVMVSDLDADKAASTTQANTIAEKIRAALAAPYRLTVKHDGGADSTVEHQCNASLGAVVFAQHEGSQEDFLKWADAAMYMAKEAGGNLIRFHVGNASISA